MGGRERGERRKKGGDTENREHTENSAPEISLTLSKTSLISRYFRMSNVSLFSSSVNDS